MQGALPFLLGMVVVLCAPYTLAYKPVICLHGFSGSTASFSDVMIWFQKYRPTQIAISLDFNNGIDSFKPMWIQLSELETKIRGIVKGNSSFANGYHLIGHSQGGLMMRSLIEDMDDHNVDTFLSVAGVQGGYYGLAWASQFFPNVSLDALDDILYSWELQDTLSLANWWRSPYHIDDYHNENIYLPVVDDIVKSNSTDRYKKNFLRMNKMIMFGSNGDSVLDPWQTAHFGFYRDGSDDKNAVTPMSSQQVYTGDSFGLKSLDARGGLTTIAVDGIDHSAWLHNETIFTNYFLPYLV